MMAIRTPEAADHGRLTFDDLQSCRRAGASGIGQTRPDPQLQRVQVQNASILDGVLPVHFVASEAARHPNLLARTAKLIHQHCVDMVQISQAVPRGVSCKAAARPLLPSGKVRHLNFATPAAQHVHQKLPLPNLLRAWGPGSVGGFGHAGSCKLFRVKKWAPVFFCY